VWHISLKYFFFKRTQHTSSTVIVVYTPLLKTTMDCGEVWRRAKWAYLFCSKEVWGVTPPRTRIKFCKRADLSNGHVIFSRGRGGGEEAKKPLYLISD
jgi:hypothetical protein